MYIVCYLFWLLSLPILTFCKVVPSEDSHQSEYIAPCDGRRG